MQIMSKTARDLPSSSTSNTLCPWTSYTNFIIIITQVGTDWPHIVLELEQANRNLDKNADKFAMSNTSKFSYLTFMVFTAIGFTQHRRKDKSFARSTH
uniref:Uncharacterized protein n=1 Tax=Tanacetum cinerariifolium TaxID=118510 RepID=A0A6L2NVC5_TANCI|nr:hypothetical protein [Tanacetum cinerariifolium]